MLPVRSSLLRSSHAFPDGAQLSANVHAPPFQDRQANTDSFSHRSLCCPTGVACTPQRMAVPSQLCAFPVSRQQPNNQGWGCSHCPPAAQLLTRQVGWTLAAMSCPNTPRSPDYSWTPALILLLPANHHWFPLPTSLQCHSKFIFNPVPFVLSSIHLDNILLFCFVGFLLFFLFLLPITIPFSPPFP